MPSQSQVADEWVTKWGLRVAVVLLSPFPLYGLGRFVMWSLLPRAEFEQVLISGHTFSIWLGGWGVLSGAGFIVSYLSTESWKKAAVAACVGSLLGFWVIGLGVGTGATKAFNMSPYQRQQALAEARVTSHPKFWRICCVRAEE